MGEREREREREGGGERERLVNDYGSTCVYTCSLFCSLLIEPHKKDVFN